MISGNIYENDSQISEADMIRSEYKTDTRRAVTDFLKSHSDRHFTVNEIISA